MNFHVLSSTLINFHVEKCSCGGWTTWSECGHSCGGGYQTRKRQCTPPKSGVDSCAKEEQETQLCNLNVCPRKKIVLILFKDSSFAYYSTHTDVY